MDETKTNQQAPAVEGEVEPEAEKEPSRRYLLVIALLMVFVSIAAYMYEEELFDVFYNSNLFVAGLTIPVVIALLCLFGYSNLTLKSSSRTVVRRSQPKSGVTYNVFSGQTVGDVKASHGRRKSARHLRKQLARNTPPPNQASPEDSDQDNSEEDA